MLHNQGHDTVEFDEEYWLSLITDGNGDLNKEKILAELKDFNFVIDQVPKVYLHITSDLLSKPNYYAAGVIEAADAAYRGIYTDIFLEFLEHMKDSNIITGSEHEKMLKLIPDYI